jgi:hypothetical protein
MVRLLNLFQTIAACLGVIVAEQLRLEKGVIRFGRIQCRIAVYNGTFPSPRADIPLENRCVLPNPPT